jgi:hypothetical protein
MEAVSRYIWYLRRKVNVLGGHSIGHSKQKMYMTCVLFRMVSEIELVHCRVPKLLIRKRYYVLFLIPIFTVQVIKLVQFTYYYYYYYYYYCNELPVLRNG